MKSIMKRTARLAAVATIGLTLGLLTACGGSSSKGEKVTTLPNCPANYHYNNSTNLFQYSESDLRECQVLNTTTINCSANEVLVRLPLNQSTANNNTNTGINCPVINGIQNCNTNNNSSVNSDYHATRGQYTEACIGSNDNNWGYIVYGAQYNYLNINYLSASAGYYISYHGSLGAAINSGDLPPWVLPVLGAGTGAVIGNSINGNDGAVNGAIIGGILGLFLN